MAIVNDGFLLLQSSYLFSDIAKRVNEFEKNNTGARLIRMGIGDVTEPLPRACVSAFHLAVDELASKETFKGYGPEQGYAFLREAIALNDYQSLSVNVSADEIFISDGSKCDCGNIQELFSLESIMGIPDPVYPVYLDSNIMAGRGGKNNNGRYDGISYLDTGRSTGFLPVPPEEKLDVVYLCSPNNPTGAVFTREQLAAWVNYAQKHKAIILFDAAYFAFIQDPSLPRSIYEIEGAREVAIEFRSFSKTAGFTGTRCAFTVVPKECVAYASSGDKVSLHSLWLRRQSTKFNGVSYPVQKAAAAIYTESGSQEVKELVSFYMDNAKIIKSTLLGKGYDCYGGDNAPYVWVDTKSNSWEFFDSLLKTCSIVCTPGVGFGKCGEGFVRFSAFNSRSNVTEAMERISKL